MHYHNWYIMHHTQTQKNNKDQPRSYPQGLKCLQMVTCSAMQVQLTVIVEVTAIVT